jgi:rare lipoprotein A
MIKPKLKPMIGSVIMSPHSSKRTLRSLGIAALVLLSSCAHQQATVQDGPPRFAVDVSRIPDAVPHKLVKSKEFNPHSYVANGHRYYVMNSERGYSVRGIASWYGTKFQGHYTSNNERYDLLAMTAASKELPIPCFVRVTNLENGRSVIVKVNDRGPFAPNRVIDLSYVAAKKLGYSDKGTALVQVTAIDCEHPSRIPRPQLLKHPTLYLQLGAFTERSNAERLAR